MRRLISFICSTALLFSSFVSVSAVPFKDTTPPIILSITPSAGQINVNIDAAFVVKFNEPVAKGLNFAKIALLNSQRKAIPITLSIKGDILTATLSSKLSWSSAYTLAIPNGAVKDLAGNRLAKPYSVSFRTVPQPILLSEELKQVVAGISKLSVPNPGALEFTNNQWLPVAGAESDMNSVFLAARTYGNGRILAIGKEDLLSNDNIYTLDNLQFIKNAFKWLNGIGVKRVGYSFGHDEFINSYSLASLSKELYKDKFIFSETKLTTTDLKTKDILIIGNPWKSLSKAEISAVEGFVSNGGSLILAGLGWSYHDYHPGSPYPMNVLSLNFGVRWADTAISDTSEKYKDAPVFNIFFPNVNSQDKILQDAMNYIKKITAEHPTDLSDALERDSLFKSNYIKAHLIIARKVIETEKDDISRQKIYNFCKEIVKSYPQYFSKKTTFDIVKYPTITWLRERLINTWISSIDITDQNKSEIAAICGFDGRYLDMWNNSTIYIADNNGLDEAQKKYLYDIFNLIPRNLHDIRIISVENLIQADLKDMPYLAFACIGTKYVNTSLVAGDQLTMTAMSGNNSFINITNLKINDALENSFPDRANPRMVSIFSASTAHEINHIVDFYTVNKTPELNNRRNQLIKAAGDNPSNYLRSMFEKGFFIKYPAEFLASIANSWFTDSENTLKLGLSDLDKGINQPINQALFFAEVYSQGKNFTYFYNSDISGNLTRTTIPLTRDAKGRIKSIAFDGYNYEFILDDNGDVTSYTATKM